MMRCPACGGENPDAVAVCSRCGANLNPGNPGPLADPDRMVLVHSFTSEPAAEAAAQALEANGILCNVFTDDCGGMLPPLQQFKGIRLFVASRDAVKAQEIIQELDSPSSAPLPPDIAPAP